MNFCSVVKLLIFSMVLTYSVSGCVKPAEENKVSLEDRQPIEVLRALATFVNFCHGYGPSFDSVEDKALSGNFRLMPNGWLEHSYFQVSMAVRDYKDFKNCQFGFTSDQSSKVFEEHMKHPFNARELSKAETRKLYSSDFPAEIYMGFISKIFVSKTTFDDDIPAVLYGYIINYPKELEIEGKNSFGLILQVGNE